MIRRGLLLLFVDLAFELGHRKFGELSVQFGELPQRLPTLLSARADGHVATVEEIELENLPRHAWVDSAGHHRLEERLKLGHPGDGTIPVVLAQPGGLPGGSGLKAEADVAGLRDVVEIVGRELEDIPDATGRPSPSGKPVPQQGFDVRP